MLTVFSNRNWLFALISYISLYGIEAMLKIQGPNSPVNNSIFSVIIVIAVFILLKSAYKVTNRRLCIISCIIGAMFSMCMIFGTNILFNSTTHVFEGTTGANKLDTWATIISGTPLFAALVTLLYNMGKVTCISNRLIESGKKYSNKIVFFSAWVLIFCSWLPALIATYPGIDGYDTIYQIAEYKSGLITSHHPIIHTYLLGFCTVTLGDLFGNVESGFLVYSLIQMLILSAVFAVVYTYLYKLKLKTWFRIVFLISFMFLPTNAIMAISSTKDILFSAFFTLSLVLIFEAYHNCTVLNQKAYWICLNITLFLTIAFRKTGIYIFLLGAILSLILLNKYRKQLFIFIIICIVEYTFYFGPVEKFLGVVEPERNSINEMMSVPCVQLSRALVQDTDKLSEEEISLITEYIPGYEGYIWQPGIADTMKNTFNSERFFENPGEFIKLYLSVGRKLPIDFIDAFARLSIGMWYPDMNYRDWGAFHPYWEYIPDIEDQYYERTLGSRELEEGENILRDFYEDISFDNTYQNTPMISMFFSSGAISWAIFLYIGYCIYSKRYKYLVPAAFVFGIWLTQLIGPVVLYRYIYPLIVSAPLFIGSLVGMNAVDDLTVKSSK